ncbi:MAG: flippase [Leptolyngbyaceae cyanobacterium]
MEKDRLTLNMFQKWPAPIRQYIDRLFSDSEARKIITNIGWLSADRLIRMVFGICIGVFVARYLGPNNFGLFNYAVAFISIFSIIASLGIETITVRELVNHPDERETVLSTVFGLKLIAGMLSFLVLITSSYLIHPGTAEVYLIIWVLSLTFLLQPFDTVDLWYQSNVEAKYGVYAKSSAFLITSAFKLLFIYLRVPLIGFVWLVFLETLIASSGLIIGYIRSHISVNVKSFCRITATRLLKDGLPLMLSGILITIYMKVDQIMLVKMINEKELGLYSVAVKLTEAWHFIPMAVVPSIFPNLISSKGESISAFYSKLQILYDMMAVSAYAIALPMMLMSGSIVQLLYGVEYTNAAPMLAILIWSNLFVNLGVARSSFLTAMNYTKLYLMCIFIGCLINIVLNTILIPTYGGIGAANATDVAFDFAGYIYCL